MFASDDPQAVPLSKVLADELEDLGHARPAITGKEPARVKALEEVFNKKCLSALCLSGGGIRSATFALGTIQALASHKLLEQFDYLSTVSGGGYIGSWLSAWKMRRVGRQGPGANQHEWEHISKQLANWSTPSPEVGFLREFTSYLSPQRGLLSADTWTLVAIYLRNLILNWLIFLPAIASVFMLPRVFVAVAGLTYLPSWTGWLLIIGGGLQAFAMAYADIFRAGAGKAWHHRDTLKCFLWGCFLPMALAAVFLSLAWVGIEQLSIHQVADANCLLGWIKRQVQCFADVHDIQSGCTILGFAIFESVIGGIAWIVAVIVRCGTWDWPVSIMRAIGRLLLECFVTLIVVPAILGWLLWVVAKQPFFSPIHDRMAYASIAIPVYLLAFLLSGALLRGLLSLWTSDADREWSARAGGWVLLLSLAWMLASVLVLYGPDVLANRGPILRTLISAAGGVAGIGSALLGFSAKTPANADEARKLGAKGSVTQFVLALAAPLFIVFFVVVLSVAIDGLITRLWPSAARSYLIEFDPSPSLTWHDRIVTGCPFWVLLLWIAAFLLIVFIMSWFVDINKFSLHTTYRNRLVRAYLGASNLARKDDLDQFIGFSESDNSPIYKLAGGRPLHVINTALNLVHGKNLAWQERKAESFTMTRLHCGCASIKNLEDDDVGTYRSSKCYGGKVQQIGRDRPSPISLGTAMAISGAAASPNMGYYSSPAVAFLMTLFNVRLGVWLGNPGKAGEFIRAYGHSSPRFGLARLLEEALGLTDDNSAYVNLSDGGHFDNLGLYEMVRRRCRRIIVIDAGADRSYAFSDLANAVRKIYIDLKVRIKFEPPIAIRAEAMDPGAKRVKGEYFAIGEIEYPEAGGAGSSRTGLPGKGLLLYVKPALYGSEPVDIFNYRQRCPDFPHESTVDQFFTESQFESYRNLGQFIMRQICQDSKSPTQPMSMDQLFEQAHHWLHSRRHVH